MSAEMLGWLGVVLTVVFGVSAFFGVKKLRQSRQVQKVERGGTAYQAGRDINVGKDDV